MSRWMRLIAGVVVSAAFLGAAVPARAAGPEIPNFEVDAWKEKAKRAGAVATAWYERTPAADRITWGGLAAAGILGLGVTLERMRTLRYRRVIPSEFSARFIDRMRDGKLDRGKALDFCELNSSPASRVALAAVRRWGRPVSDLERAVGLIQRIEADRLRRNVGTLRRVAAMAPLIGLLGSLLAATRTLAGLGQAAHQAQSWGPAIAGTLGPLTAGVSIAIIAMVIYDGLMGKVEALAGALERVGAETIDAIALAMPAESRIVASPASGPAHSARTPHQIRLDLPKASRRIDRAMDRDEDFD